MNREEFHLTRPGKDGRAKLLFFALILALVFTACGSRTVVGGYSDSPDKKYRVYGRIFGATGHAFTDNTGKTVRISVVKNDKDETLIFRRDYRVHGGCVEVDTMWDAENNLSGVVYDYGDLTPAMRKLITNPPPKRVIRKFSYRFDTQTAKFREQSKN